MWNANFPSAHWPVKHGIYPPQLSERVDKVILTTEFNLDAEVHAIPVSIVEKTLGLEVPVNICQGM